MTLGIVDGVVITQHPGGRVSFVSDADIDADGANGISRHPDTFERLFAYAPEDKGLDSLRGSAGYPNHSWWRNILVNTDDDPSEENTGHGTIINFNGGYYSKTTYFNRRKHWNEPDRYLDACGVPYIVVPPLVRRLTKGIVIGCRAEATWRGQSVDCVVGDISGPDTIGEMSVAAAVELGINSNPRTGGTVLKNVYYNLWPGVPAIVQGIKYDLIGA